MGKTFDLACQSLHDNGQPELVRQIIAKRIIAVARKGERDPDELCARALPASGFRIRQIDRAAPQLDLAFVGAARPLCSTAFATAIMTKAFSCTPSTRSSSTATICDVIRWGSKGGWK